MSIRRNSNKNSFYNAAWIVPGIVAVMFLLTNYLNNSAANKKQTVSEAPVLSSAGVNPLLKMLSEGIDPSSDLNDGIAIGVAIDVSGSMNDGVKDSDGSTRPKIDIANRCVLNILDQTAAYAGQSADNKIQIGIFEFSSKHRQPSCRQIIPFGPIQVKSAKQALSNLRPEGCTPIGDAIITIKQLMNGAGLSKQHLLVITDGANNQGYDPADVVDALSRIDGTPTNVYFFAFDVAEEKFNGVRQSGGLVLAASNGQELEQTLSYVLSGKILVEQPQVPGAK